MRDFLDNSFDTVLMPDPRNAWQSIPVDLICTRMLPWEFLTVQGIGASRHRSQSQSDARVHH